jgi:cold-inducible RNA-binding protein
LQSSFDPTRTAGNDIAGADRCSKEKKSMGTRLFVGNLSYRVTEAELKQVFEEGGRNVVEVKVVTDRDTGRSRGFAFVELANDQDATAAIQTLSGREVAGRAINVSEARARSPRGGGGAAWGGGDYAGGGGGGRERDGGAGYEGRGRRGSW